jgi:hypothetical protein
MLLPPAGPTPCRLEAPTPSKTPPTLGLHRLWRHAVQVAKRAVGQAPRNAAERAHDLRGGARMGIARGGMSGAAAAAHVEQAAPGAAARAPAAALTHNPPPPPPDTPGNAPA